jgi:dihydroneopterin aldolase
MNDLILITRIHGFGYHGLFDHERTNGQDFFVDVSMRVDLLAASISDDIEDTVNYGLITELVVNEITSDPVSLIEKLAGRIAEKILNTQEKALEVSITVHKPQAPVGVKVSDIAVTITRTR